MTKVPNPIPDQPGAGLANPSASVTVGDINIKGNVEGNIVIGNNNKVYDVRVHNQVGAVFNFQVEPIIERHKMIPQPPRPPRGFVGRSIEQEKMQEAITGREATFVYGHDGLGKTSFIRQVANKDPAKKMPDGVVFLEGVDEMGRALGFHDVVQLLFDAFYVSNPPLKANLSNAKTHLSNTVPLVILDGFDLPATAFDKIPDLFPHGALLVASRSLSTEADVFQSYQLSPLTRKDSVQLLVDKSGIPANTTNLAALDKVCELCGDVPLAIAKIANVIQRRGLELASVLVNLENIQTPSRELVQASIERSFGVIYSLLNESERAALALVAAAPGISVDRRWLEGVTQDPNAVAELEALELIQANSPRMRMADGLRQIILSRPADLRSRRGLLLEHLLTELRSRSLDFDFIANELGNILGLLDWAANEKRWAEVVALGRAVDPYLTLKGLWDAWGNVLKLVLQAGQFLRDQSVQAWALHQLGSREIGVGSRGQAIKHLVNALRIREAISDKVGAAYTRHNLNIILPPRSSDPKDTQTSPDKSFPEKFKEWVDNIRYKLRNILIGYPRWFAIGLLIFIAIVAGIILSMLPPGDPTPPVCQKPGGWQEYIVQEGDTLDSISERVASAMGTDFRRRGLPVIKLAIKNANFNCAEITIPPGTIPSSEPEVEPRQRIAVPEIPKSLIVPSTKPPVSPSVINLEISTNLNGATEIRDDGQVINYIYDISNAGGRPLEGRLNVTDDRVTEVICPEFGAVGNLDGFFDPNERITCTGTYNVTQADIDYGSVTNVAIARVGERVSNQKTHTVKIAQIPGLEITKQADPVIYTHVGQEITYIYTVQNSGNVTLGPVTIFVKDDQINNGEEAIICGPESTILAQDGEVNCSATYVITEADMEARSVTNVAHASVNAFGYNLMNSRRAAFKGNQTATATVNYADPPALELTVIADTLQPFDTIGQTITYNYLIKNSGGMALAGPANVTDDKAATTCPNLNTVGNLNDNLDPAEQITCTGTYPITQEDLDAGSVTNNATASIGGTNSNLVSYVTNMRISQALRLTNAVSPTSYSQANQIITYTYVIVNTGNVTLDGPFSVADDKTTPNCQQPNAGFLSPNEEMSCTATYTISQADRAALSVTNSATAANGAVTSVSVTTTINFSCPPIPTGWVVYVIQSGDTLYNISTWYPGTSSERLIQANCLSSITIRPGQNLYVPSPPPPATISGIVFSDPNRNNTRDPGEEGVPNITLTLLDYNTRAVIATTTTNNNGEYIFQVFKPGNYQIFQDVIQILRIPPSVEVGPRDFGISPAN